MTANEIVALAVVGFALGVAVGWFAWRLPILFAEQRGVELDEDGYTICKKEVAEAGRKALCAKDEQ